MYKATRLYTALDVEGHDIDGKFYLVDLARTFPPEHPYITNHLLFLEPDVVVSAYRVSKWEDAIIVRVNAACGTADVCFNSDKSTVLSVPGHLIRPPLRAVFWRHLRPEFVKNRGVPLLKRSTIRIIEREYEEQSSGDDSARDAAAEAVVDYDTFVPADSSEVTPSHKKYSDIANYNQLSGRSESHSFSNKSSSVSISAPLAQSSSNSSSGSTGGSSALSPDILSEFSRGDPCCEEMHRDIVAATAVLTNGLIPALVIIYM